MKTKTSSLSIADNRAAHPPRTRAKASGDGQGASGSGDGHPHAHGVSDVLPAEDAAQLRQWEKAIEQAIALEGSICQRNAAASREKAEAFHGQAPAFYEIREKKLFRAHGSFDDYCHTRWRFRRAYGYRLAKAGEILSRVSPHGDTKKLLMGEAHFRVLESLDAEQQDTVISTIASWTKMAQLTEVSPRMVESAKLVLCPPKEPKDAASRDENVSKFMGMIEAAEASLDPALRKSVAKTFVQMKRKVEAMSGPARTTGIDWTDSTWNTVYGCRSKSKGCRKCWAAKLFGTRLAEKFPGLVEAVVINGTLTYRFKNVIHLLPERLGDPLRDRTPKRIFVNSVSDLFHEKVPDAYIEAVFDVMEKAHWHQFQVLTKRPERMAQFTQRRYQDKAPPPNVWMGTSTEDQAAFDERLPHLLKVKAAVRWLSIEPLLGPLICGSLKGIDWVVVGGESGSKRPMALEWATAIRDACKKDGVPFFFKQWSDYDVDGKKIKKEKKDRLTPPPLEGVIHNAYPQMRQASKPTRHHLAKPALNLLTP